MLIESTTKQFFMFERFQFKKFSTDSMNRSVVNTFCEYSSSPEELVQGLSLCRVSGGFCNKGRVHVNLHKAPVKLSDVVNCLRTKEI